MRDMRNEPDYSMDYVRGWTHSILNGKCSCTAEERELAISCDIVMKFLDYVIEEVMKLGNSVGGDDE